VRYIVVFLFEWIEAKPSNDEVKRTDEDEDEDEDEDDGGGDLSYEDYLTLSLRFATKLAEK